MELIFDAVHITGRKPEALLRLVPCDLHNTFKAILQQKIPFKSPLGQVGEYQAYVQCNPGELILVLRSREGIDVPRARTIENWAHTFGCRSLLVWPLAKHGREYQDVVRRLAQSKYDNQHWSTGLV
ncbi:MAG TPA: hypothetical protein VFZ48_02530 [Candidatus Saccharimonadales bacterium]